MFFFLNQFIILVWIMIMDSCEGKKKDKQQGDFSTTQQKSGPWRQILDISQSSARYKVFTPAKANMLLLGRKAYTMKYNSHTQYCTSILGHHQGVQPFFLTARGAASLANRWPGRASQRRALRSSHNYPNTELLATPICFVYRATWTCIWSARV